MRVKIKILYFIFQINKVCTKDAFRTTQGHLLVATSVKHAAAAFSPDRNLVSSKVAECLNVVLFPDLPDLFVHINAARCRRDTHICRFSIDENEEDGSLQDKNRKHCMFLFCSVQRD